MNIRTALLFLCLFSLKAYGQEKSYPVSTSEDPPPFGLYRTAQDYLNLTPTETQVIFKHIPRGEGESSDAFFKMDSSGKKGPQAMPKDYFAGSDGKTFYIAHGRHWNKAKKSNNGYYFIVKSDLAGQDDGSTLYTYNNGLSSGIAVPIGRRTRTRYNYSIEEGKWVTAGSGTKK